jgi:hypothetical protein
MTVPVLKNANQQAGVRLFALDFEILARQNWSLVLTWTPA